ncbi:MAG: hypothetical protein JNM19_05785 [Chitinophagaceae bacterium]|nr:hypothetical protein [Chitinophagaceae bacterium]
MKIISTLLSILFVTLFGLLLPSCNDSKQKVEIRDVRQDTPTSSHTPPPPGPPEKTVLPEVPAEKNCFTSSGLKYETKITLYLADTLVLGNIISEEYEAGKKEWADFTGTIHNEVVKIKFKGNAPVIGDASEWTDKPWKLIKANGNKKLLIPFKAKNYENNKWEEMEYEFNKTDCN